MQVQPMSSSTPGPLKLPLLGNTLAFGKSPHQFLRTMAQQYGDVVQFEVVRRPHFLFTHPDQVREILVTKQGAFRKSMNYDWMKDLLGNGLFTSNGETHLRRRRLVQPAFQRSRVDAYADTMADNAIERLATWRDGSVRDITKEMDAMTLRNVSQTMVSDDLDMVAELLHQGTSALRDWWELHMHPLGIVLRAIPVGATRRFRRSCRELRAALEPIIARRRREGRDVGDFLSMLMLADDEHEGQSLDDNELFEELITILTTGHGTIAAVLAWTWYLLAQHPEAEAQLHAELDEKLGEGPVTVAALERLEWLPMVFKEVLRLYPPGWALGRHALEDVDIGTCRVPAGSTVLVSPYVTHRDPRWFDEAERFNPERWRHGAKRPTYAYMPFGGGARQCIGERFANLEGHMIVASVARQWRVGVRPRDVGASSKITFRPAVALPSLLERRN